MTKDQLGNTSERGADMKPNAKSSVLQLSGINRALGRVVEIPDPDDESPSVQDLFSDSFHSLYGSGGFLDEVPEDRPINRMLLEWAQTTPSWSKMIGNTSGSIVSSALTTLVLGNSLLSDEAFAEAMAIQEKLEETLEEQQQFQQDADEAGEEGDEEGAAQAQAKADEAGEKAEAISEQLQKATEEMPENPFGKGVMAGAVSEAGEKAEQVADALGGFGLEDGTDDSSINANEAIEFAERFTDKIQQIAKLAGRFRGLATNTRENRQSDDVVPIDADFVRDPSRMFVGQLAQISPHAHKALRALQIARLDSHGLPGWDVDADGDSYGPFVALIDESGSMGGQPEILAKAVSYGLAQAARKDMRPYHLVGFSSHERHLHSVSSEDGWQEHMKFFEMFPAHGTNIGMALQYGLGKIEEMGKAGHSADLVLVTDGQGYLHQDDLDLVNLVKDRTGLRLLLVAIGYSVRENTMLHSIADKIIHVSDLYGDNADRLTEELAGWVR